jgi:cell division protein FtsZ
MTSIADLREMRPRIIVFGVGGAGGNAINNMIVAGLQGVDFVVANTDAQALTSSKAPRTIQMGVEVTEGLGAGSQPDVGRAAAEEAIDAIHEHLTGAHMVFITAGMGGGTGTGAAPVIAKTAHELGILTIGVVTKPFHFEGKRRMRLAEAGIAELQRFVDTLLIIPNQNLFRVVNQKTTFADAFAMADQVLYSGVACITDLIVKEGLINLDYADVRAVMREKGKAMMGMGEASGEKRVLSAAEAAISNPLIEDPSIKRASGLLISISGGKDLTLFEVDEAASLIREEADQDANVIVGATFDDSLEGTVRVSVVATGIDNTDVADQIEPRESALAELAAKLRNDSCRIADSAASPMMAQGASLQRMTTRSLLDAAQTERSMPAASIPEAAEHVERMRRRPQELSDGYPEQRHMTLIQRLAVGLGRRAVGGSSARDDAASRTIDPNSTSDPRSCGRGYQHAISNSVDQGVLDIPAFLRRGTESSR